MEEFENIGEQPQNVQPSVEENVAGSPSEEVTSENGAANEAERGVPVGKFKSVEDLLNAYNHLEAEFTRKSQKLADLQAAMPKLEENKDSLLQSFLSKNQEAAFYAEQIAARVEGQQVQDEAAFERAFADILFEKLSGKDKAKEPIIQNLILKDDEIQNLVIKNYMKQLQEQKTPIVMSSASGERVTKTVTPKPDTFDEAKRVVLDLLS